MPLTIWINTKLIDDPQTRLEMVAKGFSDRNLASVNRVCFGEPDKVRSYTCPLLVLSH